MTTAVNKAKIAIKQDLPTIKQTFKIYIFISYFYMKLSSSEKEGEGMKKEGGKRKDNFVLIPLSSFLSPFLLPKLQLKVELF